MRVAILSDTHARSADVSALMERLRPHIQGVDLILHAGDITSPEVLDALAQVAPVEAVAGNMDGPDITSRLPERRLVSLGPFRLGLIHGWGAPQDLARKVWERFTDQAGQAQVQAIAFGHSHQPLIETRGGVLMINPGSAMDRRGARACSLAILLVGDTLEARIVELPERVD